MRLYRLPQPISFQCSNCSVISNEDYVAIAAKGKVGVSRKLLCRACYYKLAKCKPMERPPVKAPQTSRQKSEQKPGRKPNQPKPPKIKPHARARVLDSFPAYIPRQIVNACLEASHRIRFDRQVAYENPLVLECATGVLTLHPITGTPPHLHIPFQLRTMAMSASGELLLRNKDPLPMLVNHDLNIDDAITAWVHALLGFADATCIEVAPTVTHGALGALHPRLAATVPRKRTSTRPVPQRHPWPGQLEPIGSWIQHGASFVAGHRRRLSENQVASDDAVERALLVGIALNPHETWVRPHTRGIPKHTEMRFRWHVQTELRQISRGKLLT
jgi:hypothetical protein